jgi:cytoskeleton protein RodZ
MPTRDEEAGLPIGEALKRARSRQELDIRTVEAQTKIRVKYLRALENEEWEVLPGHPYAKGFLRTYAQFLGLDGGALVDEYRRRVESSLGADAPFAFTEPVLEHRRRPGEEPGRRWSTRAIAMGALAAATVVAFLIFAVGGSDHTRRNHHHQRAKHQHHHSGGARGSGGGDGSSQPVTLS